MSNSFRNQTFVADSGKLGMKISVVDDVLSSHQQQICPTTLFYKNYIEFEFQADWNQCVCLTQSNLALKMKFVKSRGGETFGSQEVRKEHKQETKGDDAMEGVDKSPVPLVIQVNNILHSVFSNIEVYINNQQSYNSNGLPAYKLYICNNFKGGVSKNKGVLYCKGYDNEEEFPEEIDMGNNFV